MKWKFWKSSNESNIEQSLKKLIEEVFQINKGNKIIEEHLQKYENSFEEANENIHSNEELIQKSIRLQYKTSQEILKELEQINVRIDEAIDNKKEIIELKGEKNRLIGENNYLIGKYIEWLDDIDLICDKLNESSQEYWRQLLNNWQSQILKSLETVGINEIDVLGKTFSSTVAESISTTKKEGNKVYLPYEVVKVLQRGFLYKDGTLLRKAKVVTIEEDGENNV